MARQPTNTALNKARKSAADAVRRQYDAARVEQRLFARETLNKAASRAVMGNRKTKVEEALTLGTAQLAHKVLGSFGISTQIRVTIIPPSELLNATGYTDFDKIYIGIKSKAVDLTNMDSVADFIYLVKGVVYHEGGHIVYTVPLNELIERVKSTPVGIGTIKTIRADGNNEISRAWNILEDQRMERAMVLRSPVLANYYSKVVLSVVINPDDPGHSWPLVSGRKYLNDEVRKELRALAEQQPGANLIPEIDACIDAYCKTNSPEEQLTQVVRFMELLREWNPDSSFEDGSSSHASTRNHASTRKQKRVEQVPEEGDPTPSNSNGEDNKENKQTGAGSGQQQQSENGENDGQEGNDSPGMAEQADGHDSQTSGANGVPGDGAGKSDSSVVAEKIAEELERIKKSAQREAQEFVTHINEELRQDLRKDVTLTPMEPLGIAAADEIANGVVNALDHLIDHTSPSWRFRQENGVLDPVAFTLRDPGETDYWSGMEGTGSLGYDLSVSVLLDTSYSMMYQTDKLSVCALAIRKACDILEIPCTVSTYNTNYGVLYRHDEPVQPSVAHANGGTEPAPLLDMLDGQRLDKKRHLVLILTDGDWEGVTTLAPWVTSGRYFYLVGIDGVSEYALQEKQPNYSSRLSSIMELPGEFRKAVSGFMA